ncbi:Pyridoxal 5'-phosphate synthase [Beutenbergia cavernae DSM 12333]|uniref:Pyridoxal 5'-phosphate synthase n=1 Tax=Beutenbergia cavernae (strain ATCC BAA-8 / DSM 12333 / CCUG 43141 / JCM 11478 / NBRC 16432 / NCIMB 13614 / HKI 0122) TaxID=471853 RepID=C5BX85_BEUC1|nr:pyridoxamine 5'-phosphate oxidase family protein [Beutenbergia cavernae]ACQ78760.1 Pyridoxal 5'-phosphate synthase [Beutenbergia cavernae DSM 12333]
MTSWRERLRALPTIPAEVEDLDVATLPGDPVDLFTAWLTEAIDAGVPAPHAMTIATSGLHGEVSARALILKDVGPHGWAFATRRDSLKGAQIADNPRAALVFLWPALGHQVRVVGPVRDLGDDAAAADFAARSPYSRASALAGHQGDELADVATHRRAYADALARAQADPDLTLAAWRVYAVVPREVEFWHSSAAGQVRVVYSRPVDDDAAPGGAWRRTFRWP